MLRKPTAGHSLLEAIVAAGVFVMVAVALSGVWVMYGSALAKSAEHLAANHLARSVTEGLIANGYEWLKTDLAARSTVVPEEFPVFREVRARKANIVYNVTYTAALNTEVAGTRPLFWASQDVCQVKVSVRWRSDSGSKPPADGTDFNNEVSYTAYVYKGALN